MGGCASAGSRDTASDARSAQPEQHLGAKHISAGWTHCQQARLKQTISSSGGDANAKLPRATEPVRPSIRELRANGHVKSGEVASCRSSRSGKKAVVLCVYQHKIKEFKSFFVFFCILLFLSEKK